MNAETLLPALDALAVVTDARVATLADTVKTGRTHLMNAVPLTFGQELDGWSAQRRLGWSAAAAVIGHHALQGQQVFRVGARTE